MSTSLAIVAPGRCRAAYARKGWTLLPTGDPCRLRSEIQRPRTLSFEQARALEHPDVQVPAREWKRQLSSPALHGGRKATPHRGEVGDGDRDSFFTAQLTPYRYE